MHVRVLPACMCVHHVGSRFGVPAGSPGTGARNGFELMVVK